MELPSLSSDGGVERKHVSTHAVRTALKQASWKHTLNTCCKRHMMGTQVPKLGSTERGERAAQSWAAKVQPGQGSWFPMQHGSFCRWQLERSTHHSWRNLTTRRLSTVSFGSGHNRYKKHQQKNKKTQPNKNHTHTKKGCIFTKLLHSNFYLISSWNS